MTLHNDLDKQYIDRWRWMAYLIIYVTLDLQNFRPETVMDDCVFNIKSTNVHGQTLWICEIFVMKNGSSNIMNRGIIVSICFVGDIITKFCPNFC